MKTPVALHRRRQQTVRYFTVEYELLDSNGAVIEHKTAQTTSTDSETVRKLLRARGKNPGKIVYVFGTTA